MPLLADTHVHLYPVHDADRLLGGALDRLRGQYRGEAACVVALTERHDCRAFRDLRDGRLKPASFTVTPAGPHALTLRRADGRALHIIAGRQVAARERLEILALGVDAEIPDGEPIRDTIRRTRDAGALPVLAWAPGKWLFKRGKIVAALLDESAPGTLLIGDTALRPTLWVTPELMSYASLKGLKVIAGSDPLPAAGEEHVAGTHASFFEAAFDEADPAGSFRRILLDPKARPLTVGRRGSVMAVWSRLRAFKRASQ
jgi:hypothetical protein